MKYTEVRFLLLLGKSAGKWRGKGKRTFIRLSRRRQVECLSVGGCFGTGIYTSHKAQWQTEIIPQMEEREYREPSLADGSLPSVLLTSTCL